MTTVFSSFTNLDSNQMTTTTGDIPLRKPQKPQGSIAVEDGLEGAKDAHERTYQSYNCLKLPRIDDINEPNITAENYTRVILTVIKQIESQTDVLIIIHPPLDKTQYEGKQERVCIVYGTVEAVANASIRLQVVFDNLYGLEDKCHDIDEKLLHTIAGCHQRTIQDIMNTTSTNIYLSPPLLHSMNLTGQYPTTIWITGKIENVNKAWEMITTIANSKQSLIYEKLHLHPKKIEWMKRNNVGRLQEIMFINGTYIGFPGTEINSDFVYVYGDNRDKIHCTVRSTLRLARDFIITSFKLLRTPNSKAFTSDQEILQLITRISNLTGAEITFKANKFELFGVFSEVSQAVSQLFEDDIVKTYDHIVFFIINLWTEYHDFIRGKQDGKLLGIKRSTGTNILITEGSNQICLQGTDSRVLEGLRLFQEELPAEISFYIPEKYHKCIIGIGGKNAKELIKRHRVFLKFFGSGQPLWCDDVNNNVMAMTPSKFAGNLVNVKNEVMRMFNSRLREEKLLEECGLLSQGNHSNVSKRDFVDGNSLARIMANAKIE